MEVAKSPPIIIRVFIKRHEIRLMQSMMRYKSAKGRDSTSNIAHFTDFVNPSLSFPATKTQVSGKIERLRKKFQNNFLREVNGKKPTNYSNKHQRKLYRLSEKIWTTEVHVDSRDDDDDDEGVGDDN